jgi:UDP-N-acetylglucosamine 2-epimerase
MTDVRIVVGTRPQVIKLASLVKAFDSEGIDYAIIHTGQHYDFDMDRVFFEELKLPQPEAHLGVGSGSHASMTGSMLLKLEEALQGSRLVVVPGDTNSALAGGLAAVKMGMPVAHVEAGLRSGLQFMPEEINRVMLDHMSQLLFAPTETGRDNLLREGVPEERVHLTGDVMADNIVQLRHRLDSVEVPQCSTCDRYAYVTVHRAETVDRPENLRIVAEMLLGFPERYGIPVVFPMHPHTRARLEELGLLKDMEQKPSLNLERPVSYLTSLRLARDARLVMTDSGGLQKEAFILGTPTVTLRDVTEWTETVDAGWNRIVGLDGRKIDEAVRSFLDSEPEPVEPLKFYGEGKASARIAQLVKEYLGR